MMKNLICLLLMFVPIQAMQPSEKMIRIRSLSDADGKVVHELPQKIALECDLIREEMALVGTDEFCVGEQFAEPDLWQRLGLCMERMDFLDDPAVKSSVQKLLGTRENLAAVLKLSNYVSHHPLFDFCVSEWAERNYVLDESIEFPQEIEGAIAHKMLVRHELYGKLMELIDLMRNKQPAL